MASITISNLRPAGSDLFSDSESFMSSLSEEDLAIQGGITPTTYFTIGLGAAALGYMMGRGARR